MQYHHTGDLLTSVTDVLGHTWSYGYTGGLLTTLTDPLDRTTTVLYDAHRAMRVTDPDGHATNYDRLRNTLPKRAAVVSGRWRGRCH